MTPERWRRVKEIFEAAVECDPDRRPRLLDEACGNDTELRREVESLLAADGNSTSRLATPVVAAGAAVAAAPAPQVFGERYEVERELGRGGMSVVYLARDRQLLSRRVVVKLLLDEMGADGWVRQKFLQEMEALARIDHPGVVAVLDNGVTPAGKQFLVMQYVEGETLRAAIGRDGITHARAAGLIRQIGQALAAAHDQGIWHRDLKPENVMLQRVGPEEHVKLIDFGIARIQNSAFGGESTKVAGTLAYMAPEQLAGAACAASDLYALGVVAHEMLTGVKPSSGDSAARRDGLRELPAGAGNAIQRATSYRPEERQASVREFTAELCGALEGNTPERKPRRRLAAAGALLAALTVPAAVWMWRHNSSADSGVERASVAVLPFADLSPDHDQAYFSDGVAEEVLNSLARVPGLRVAGRTSAFQFRDRAVDAAEIGRRLRVGAILEGSLRKQGSRVRVTTQLIKASDGFHLWSNTYDREASDLFAVQEEVARGVTRALKVALLDEKPAVVRSANPEAHSAYLEGRHYLGNRTRASAGRALELFERSVKQDANYAAAWVGLGEAWSRKAVTGEADHIECYQKAQDAVERALALDSMLGEAYSARGWIRQMRDWDWPAADADYRRALELEPGNASVISRAGLLARIVGQRDRAVELSRKAILLEPLSPQDHYAAGMTFYYAGLPGEARAAFERALELNPAMEVAHTYLGRVYLGESKPDAALLQMEQEKHPAFRLAGLALAYHSLGRKAESDANLSELIAKFANVAQYFIAGVYAWRGENDKAVGQLETAFALRQPGIVNIKGDPLMKGVDTDPRFVALLKRLRLDSR